MISLSTSYLSVDLVVSASAPPCGCSPTGGPLLLEAAGVEDDGEGKDPLLLALAQRLHFLLVAHGAEHVPVGGARQAHRPVEHLARLPQGLVAGREASPRRVARVDVATSRGPARGRAAAFWRNEGDLAGRRRCQSLCDDRSLVAGVRQVNAALALDPKVPPDEALDVLAVAQRAVGVSVDGVCGGGPDRPSGCPSRWARRPAGTCRLTSASGKLPPRHLSTMKAWEASR